jgi:DMSO reductase iron-sulfur subunit
LELPLLEQAQSGNAALLCIVEDFPALEQKPSCGIGNGTALPVCSPGEQYRFHFDMTKCIGCKCCVVACNEQNGNPADILWRRVGEIEGGAYPHTRRHYLSMGCNHCLEPTCLTGCPVNAYTKDSVTGIVRHSADACIGCQYCTWNCSYGVPQYNPERGVVGKCDMCYNRLAQGQQAACVTACPEGAIHIETVRIADWLSDFAAAANSPGMPSAENSISTTRITQPRVLPHDVHKVDLDRVRPEHPHWPLVCMTVFTQLSVGAFAAILLLQLLGIHTHRSAATVALLIAGLALGASTLHLGRPIHAWRALRMWRRSWLSREVLLFSLFALVAATYAAAMWAGSSQAIILGYVTVLLGLAGVGASARLYMVPGRPAWNSPFTVAEFSITTAGLGAACGCILTRGSPLFRFGAMMVCLAVLLTCGMKLLWLSRSDAHELRGTMRLLSSVLAMRLLLRYGLICAGMLFLLASQSGGMAISFALCLTVSELLGRYLFFVSVVPTNMARDYLAVDPAA